MNHTTSLCTATDFPSLMARPVLDLELTICHLFDPQWSTNRTAKYIKYALLMWDALGPVVRTPVNANLRLNFNPGFFFLLSKALSRIIFFIVFRVSNHQIVGKEIKLNLLFKLSYLNSNLALTLGYLNPASNNPVQKCKESQFCSLLYRQAVASTY